MGNNSKDDLLRLEGLDQLIERGLKEWKVPGLSVSVVKDGELLFSNGYGFRDPEKGLKMDADTLYRIASNTKAFVSLSLAILVDEGRLDLDKPVRNYIPYFRLKDSYASENVTPRDLLCHRTGLPAHDGALHDFKTRKEMVENLQYLDSSYLMRTKLQYNNLMYMTAGHLVDCITGQKWESFVQERIFNVLEMGKSNFSYFKSRLTGNYAECFYLKDEELKQYKPHKEMDPEYIYPRSPAGGINSTANEMANWMILQLNKGEFKGKRVVSEKAFAEMHSPQMIDNWNSPYEEHGESSCGLGWFIWAYRGEKLVVHGGFFGSQVYLMPKRNIGIAVMPTLGSSLTDIILFNIFDRLLGLNQIDWTARKIKEREEAKKNQQPAVSDQIKGTSPSQALEAYCGEFLHQGYGKFIIKLDEKGLFFEDEGQNHYLRHYHYDTFELPGDDWDASCKVTFHTDAKGVISSVSAPFEPAVKDIVFTRSV
ncbi:MAG: serine hydrolase [Ruminiclostridium sp.]|nr:serine hydrolase [Ruminiclostridium sp.]